MALGKGLGAILEEVGLAYEDQLEESKAFEHDATELNIEELEIESIEPNPYQPRKHFDEEALTQLSQSIVTHGLLQPIVVIQKDDGYLLVAGERRLRAHKLAKLQTIQAIVAEIDIDSTKQRELALIENIQRENLNAMELANSYSELIDVHNITHEELSNIVYKSRSQITNTMRLLTLSEYVQKQMNEEKLSQGHAKVLVGLPQDIQKIITDTIIGQKLNVRQAETLVKNHKLNVNNKKKSSKKLQNDKNFLVKYENELKDRLPFDYKIKSNKLHISFKDETEAKEFMEIIKNT